MMPLCAVVGGASIRGSGSRGEGVFNSSSGSRMEMAHGGEPYVSLAGPDAVCVRAMFGDPSDTGQGGLSKCM